MPEGEGNPWASGIRGWISDAIEQGLSGAAGLEAYKSEFGEAVRTQTWYDLWGETAAAKANAGRFFDVDYGAKLGDEMFADWSTRGAPGFAHQVELQVRSFDTGESFSIQQTVFSDEPLSPSEAVDLAFQQASDSGIQEGGTFNVRVRSGYMTNAYRTGSR